jgi:hypothetical protein
VLVGVGVEIIRQTFQPTFSRGQLVAERPLLATDAVDGGLERLGTGVLLDPLDDEDELAVLLLVEVVELRIDAVEDLLSGPLAAPMVRSPHCGHEKPPPRRKQPMQIVEVFLPLDTGSGTPIEREIRSLTVLPTGSAVRPLSPVHQLTGCGSRMRRSRRTASSSSRSWWTRSRMFGGRTIAHS